MSGVRWVWLVCVWLGLLLGCAGRPGARDGAGAPVSGEVAWREVVGGAWVDGCVLADGIAVVGAGVFEQWTLPAEGPPQRVVRHGFDWPVGPRVVGVACDGGVVVRFADGSAMRREGEGWQRVDAVGSTDGMNGTDGTDETGEGMDGFAQGIAYRAGERTLVFDRGGWRVLVGGQITEQRWVAGDLADATWDGSDLWAVGPGGLWRWRPGQAQWSPVILPPGLRGRGLARVWQDGPFLWVVDGSYVGYALDVRGGVTRVAREPGPIRVSGAELLARLDGRRVEVRLGGEVLRVVDDEGAAVEVALGGRVAALGTLGAAEVLIGVGEGIERWRVRGPVQVARWPVGAVTRRIIAAGELVFAVGGHGVLVGQIGGAGAGP